MSLVVVLSEEQKQRIKQATGLTDVDIQAIANARMELSKYIRSFWDSPAGQRLRVALSNIAHNSGFAGAMEEIMDSVRGRIEAAAKQAMLDELYVLAWGKPKKKGR